MVSSQAKRTIWPTDDLKGAPRVFPLENKTNSSPDLNNGKSSSSVISIWSPLSRLPPSRHTGTTALDATRLSGLALPRQLRHTLSRPTVPARLTQQTSHPNGHR